jgi:AraC-like DNA-binding protein
MNYRTISPDSNLEAFVKCFWVLEGSDLEKQRIIPDGCIEMIFHYGDLYKQFLDDKKFIVQPQCFIFGQVTKPLYIEPTGSTGIIAVRFNPEGFTPFCTLPLTEIENKAIPLQKLFGDKGASLEQEVLNAENNESRVTIIESFLLGQISASQTIDRIVQSSVEILLNSNGNRPIKKLSDDINVHRRQLERRFSSVIGLSPKQLSKVIRLQGALKILTRKEVDSLTEVAHQGDYFDQAHFIKDFKEFTGVTPKDFYSENLKLSTLFIDAQ